jgi:rubrerythrin
MVEELTLDKAIDFAVQTEQLGEAVYRRMAHRFKDDLELGELFRTLAEDEKYHAQRFDKLRELARTRKLSTEEQQYLRAVSISDIFSDAQSPGKNVESITSREDALQRAFYLEKTTLQYYQAMKEVLPHEVLDQMIAEEKSHLTQVTKYMVTGAKMRGLGDKF